MQRLVTFRTIAVIASCLTLAGCGGSAEPKAKSDVKQYIVVSAVDCADNTGLEFDKCIETLQKAIAEHDKSAATYPKIEACEKTEGADRCERVGEKSYRARVTAFQITMTEKPTAIPLYAGKKATAGFRTATNTDIAADADAYIFTKSASDAAHLFVAQKRRS
jgi:uncharacterized protein YgiB involved in biofilm formation